MHWRWPTQEERLKESPKSFWIFVILVVHQGWPSHILSMLYIAWPYTLETPIDNGANTKKISPSNEVGKYLTSHTFMLSKSIVISSDLDLILDLVNCKASTIFKRKEDEEGWRGGQGEGDPWGGNFINGRLQGVLLTSIGITLGGVGVLAFLRGKCDVSKKSIARQTSSSKSESKRTVFSLGSIFTLKSIGTWTVYVQELFVSTIVDDWTC